MEKPGKRYDEKKTRISETERDGKEKGLKKIRQLKEEMVKDDEERDESINNEDSFLLLIRRMMQDQVKEEYANMIRTN